MRQYFGNHKIGKAPKRKKIKGITPRIQRRVRNTRKIEGLREIGYKVQEFTGYHFRINGTLDIYPTNERFHNLTTGERGSIKDFDKMIHEQIPS